MNDEQMKKATFWSTAVRSIASGTFAGICGKVRSQQREHALPTFFFSFFLLFVRGGR